MSDNNSLFKRGFISFISTSLKSLATLLTGILLARSLGPENYGIFAFLTSSFIALKAFTELGTSSAFYSFASKRVRSRKFYAIYFFWLIFQFASGLLFLIFSPSDLINSIWHNENILRIFLAFTAVFLQHNLWISISYLGESQRLTVYVQVFNLLVTYINLFTIFALWFFEIATLENIFLVIIITYTVFILILIYLFPLHFSQTEEKFNDILREFINFCYPFIPFILFTAIAEFVDTWILIKYGGSVEQSFFTVGLNLSLSLIIFTTALLRVFCMVSTIFFFCNKVLVTATFSLI